MTATPEQVAWLQFTQDKINALPYEALGSDQTQDRWIDEPEPERVWECRDYTVAKAKLLREQGWPPADMTVVLCNTELGDYHAVLACHAGDSIYILDNRCGPIYLWQAPVYSYTWLHQQIPGTTDFRDASGGLV